MKKASFILLLNVLTCHFVSSQSITNGLVGYWQFNGDANDNSSNAYHGIIDGASLIPDRFTNSNSALYLDGQNAAINLSGMFSNTKSYTIIFWINPEEVNNGYIFDVGTGRFVISDGHNAPGFGKLSFYDGTWKVFDNIDIQVNNWSQYGIIFNSSTNLAYGIHDGQIDTISVSYNPRNINGAVRIGSKYNKENAFFKGSVDDFIIYDRSLSEVEIQSIYNDQSEINGEATEICSNLFCNGESIGIGTSTTGSHKLAVEGSIGAREIKVEAFPNWSDFVFEKSYHLPSLIEVEKHIKEKGHLKDIPSAEEVKEEGIYLGAMDAKLLQKIEELTLYLIEQNKEIKELKELTTQQQTKIEELIKK